MKKSLLNRKNTAILILAVLVVTFSIVLEGCGSINEITQVVESINQKDKTEDAERKKIAREEKISIFLENLYLEYLLGDEKFVKEFEDFLEECFGEKEHILTCLERQKIYNDDRYEEYIIKIDKLEETKSEMSEKVFKDKKEEINNEYLESRNKIQEYLINEEKEQLMNFEKDLKKLYDAYFL